MSPAEDSSMQLSLTLEEGVPEATRAEIPAKPARRARPDAAQPTVEQAAAIGARNRDVFLEAGAGTGKTRVLVERYCDAVDLDEVPPERILAFTFTEKAAAEMRRRVRVELRRRAREAAALGQVDRTERLELAARAGEGAPITTIHGFCRRLLAATPAAAGLDPGFRVLDADETARLAGLAFDRALDDLAARDDDVAAVAGALRPSGLRSLVIGAYDDLRSHGHARPDLPPLQIEAFEGKERQEKPLDPAELAHAQRSYGAIRSVLVAFGERFQELKRSRAGVDFDDLQLFSVELLEAGGGIGQAQRERFDHLLVDEFQDTSPLQVALVNAIRGPETRLFTVGDEFQSIYAFRGADLESFREQRRRAAAGAAEVLALTGSFRSSPAVVAAVNAIGSALLDGFTPLRVGRLPAPDDAGVGGDAEPGVELLLTPCEAWNDEDAPALASAAAEEPPYRVAEARFLARRLRELADEGVEPGSMVLLLRAFTHIDVYVEALEMAGLDPYVVGGRGYWSSQQVEDARKLLACVANPLDDEALFAALASPAAGASPDALWLLRRAAGRGRHVWPTLRELSARDGGERVAEAVVELREALGQTDREALERFATELVDLRGGAAQLPLDALVERTLTAFDYDLAVLTLAGGERRAANLAKLVRMAGEYEAHEGRDLRGFLDWLGARSALRDREAEAAAATEEHEGITVMTVHAAKGLEFDCVAVADLSRSHTLGSGSPPLPMDFRGEPATPGEDDGFPSPPRVGLRLARAAAGPLTVEGYRAITDAAAQAESQESGRLIYVAASRARKRLLLSSAYKEKEADERDREHPASDSTIRRLIPAFGVEAGEEPSSEIELAAPQARPDLDASFGPQRMRVRFNFPGDPEACELSGLGGERTADEDHAPGSGERVAPPMTVLAERGASAARSLSYAALAEYSRCGYRFLTERVLGIATTGVDATAPSGIGHGDAGVALPAGANAEARMGFGRAVHELLEESALAGWSEPDPAAVAGALGRHGVDGPERLQDASAMLAAWLGSPLLAELRKMPAAAPRPELGFRLSAGNGTMLRGTIDLLVAGADSAAPLIVDFKTDRRLPDGPELPAAYAIQRDLYACAVAAATGAEEVRTAYVFLREPDRPFRDTYDAAGLAAARERIEALVERIREGDFAPTTAPHRDLCHDCPARRRLCPHPVEITGRDLEADPKA